MSYRLSDKSIVWPLEKSPYISRKISEIVYPKDSDWDGEVVVLYQTVAGLRKSLPDHRGDWYFTGDFPTPGGYKVVNQAFVNYYENSDRRSY